jgi:hypothetical protein
MGVIGMPTSTPIHPLTAYRVAMFAGDKADFRHVGQGKFFLLHHLLHWLTEHAGQLDKLQWRQILIPEAQHDVFRPGGINIMDRLGIEIALEIEPDDLRA